MSIPTIEFEYNGIVHSPFSGQPADSDERTNQSDATLLFIYYGDAASFAHVSPRVREIVGDWEELSPDDLAEKLDVPGSLMFKVDAGWNGLNFYGFAPAGDE